MNFRILIPAVAVVFVLYQCNNNSNESTNNSNPNSYIHSQLSKDDSIFYAQEGTKIAKQMYAGILSHLQKAIEEQGYYESVRYCNENALRLTDSLSQHFGIKAKRTSLKIRNPKNAPDSLEKKVLEMYATTLSKKPTIIPVKNGIQFFTPIYIAPICLNCHGKPYQDIPDVTMKALQKWYPNDEATNYELYDIRGMWSIFFPSDYRSKFINANSPNQ